MAGRRSSVAQGRGRTIWLALLFLVGFMVAVLRFGDIEAFLAMLRRAEPLWLFAALFFQASTYVSVSLGWAEILRKAGSPQPLGGLLPIALVKLFADQTIPSAGMGGNVILVERLRASGVPRGAAVAALLVSMVGFYAAYAAMALASLLILWLHGKATPLLAGLVTAFLLTALAIPSLALWLHAQGSARLPPWLERLRPVRNLLASVREAPRDLVTDRRLIVRVAGWSALIFLADAATLAVCLCALGESFLPASAFIALMLASMVATIGPIPMGLGSFEATSTATLAMLGVPVATALSATLLLRGFTLWLPLLPGFVLLRRPAS